MDPYAKTFPVRWADCDANGHMRNTSYSEYAVDTRVSYLSEHGFGIDRVREAGLGPVIVREEIDYLREVRLGEIVRIDMVLLGLSPECGRFRYLHRFTKENGQPCARLVVSGGWMDLRARKLVPAPEPLAAVLRGISRSDEYAELPPLRDAR
jgi:acyl-CoA thioester hydrolase